MEPEEEARLDIDKMLEASGWIIQDRDKIELSKGVVLQLDDILQQKDMSELSW